MIHADGATPRERRRLARIDATLEAAFGLLAAEGLDGLTVGRLAKELDQSVGALYRYFPSMDALLAEMGRRVIGEIHADIRIALEGSEDPLARIQRAADAYRRYATGRPARYHVVAAFIGDPRTILGDQDAPTIAAAMLPLLAEVQRQIVAAETGGALTPDDPSSRTLVLFAAVQGTLQLRKLARFQAAPVDLPGLVASAVDALLVGWGADPAAVRAARNPETDP